MSDHQEKDHKHRKSANSKSQQIKHHHQNQGRHHRPKLHHQSDDNDGYDTHSTTEDNIFSDHPPDLQRHRDEDKTPLPHHCHQKKNHRHVSLSETRHSSSTGSSSSSSPSSSSSSSPSTPSSSSSSSSSPSSSSSSSSSPSSSSFSSSSSSTSSSSLSSETSSKGSDRRSLKKPQHSQSCTDISRKHKYFEEEDNDTAPLIERRGRQNRRSAKQQKGKSSHNGSSHGTLKNTPRTKRGSRDEGSFRKAKSMEALSGATERDWHGNEDEIEQERRKGEARQNLMKEKKKFSAFLNEITRQVLSPMRLTTLGVTNAQRPCSPGPVSVRASKRETSCETQRQQRSRHGSADSMRSRRSSCRSPSQSLRHRSSVSDRRLKRCDSRSQTSHSASCEHNHHHHGHHHSPHHKDHHYGDHHHGDHHHKNHDGTSHRHHSGDHHHGDHNHGDHHHGDHRSPNHQHGEHQHHGNHHRSSLHHHHGDHQGHAQKHQHGNQITTDHHKGHHTPAHHHGDHHSSGHLHHHGDHHSEAHLHHHGDKHSPDRQHHHGDHHSEAHHGDHHSEAHLHHHGDKHSPGHQHPHGDHHSEAHLHHHGDKHSPDRQHHHGDHHSEAHHGDHHSEAHLHHHGDKHSPGHQHHHGDHHSEAHLHHHGDKHSPGHQHHHGDHHSEAYLHHHGDKHSPGHQHHHGDHHSEAHLHHHGDKHSPGHQHHHGDHHSSDHKHHHGDHQHHHDDHHSSGHLHHHGDHHQHHHGDHHQHHHGDHHSPGHQHHQGDHHRPGNQHHHGDHHHGDYYSKGRHHGHPPGSHSNEPPSKNTDLDPDTYLKRRSSGGPPSHPGKKESPSNTSNTSSPSSRDEEQTSFTGPSLHKEKAHELGRIMDLQGQNEGLHHSLLKTAVRMECLGEEFISSQKLLEAELQKTRIELSSLTEKFKRLHDNCSSTQQTNHLLEQKLHSVAQSMEGERERLNQRISALTEQIADAKCANSEETFSVTSVLNKTELHFQSDDAVNQMVPPITPPPAQFMDSHNNYEKAKTGGQDQSLGPVPEEEESDWSEKGDETPRFILKGSNRGPVWRHWEADVDKDSESGGEEIARQHSPCPVQGPHLQFTIHNKNLFGGLTGEGTYKITTSPNLGSAILIRSASLEEIPLARHHMQKELRGTEAMMDLHHQGHEAIEDLDNEIIHHWRSSSDRPIESRTSETESSLAGLESAERMLSQFIRGSQPAEGRGRGRTGGISDELLKGERTQL